MSEYKKLPKPGQGLPVLFPQVASEWDYDKNGELKPEHFTAYSNVKVYWKCPDCKRSWKTAIYQRTRGTRCPYCFGRILIPGENSLSTTHPDIAQEWDSLKNEGLSPEQVTSYSNRKVWWKCPKCSNSWITTVYQRTRDPVYPNRKRSGCPYCEGRRPIPGVSDLKTCCPSISEEWDPERNNGLTPEQVSVSSGRKVWWKCKVCKHSWCTRIYNRTRGYASATEKGTGCPYCAGKYPIPEKNSLKARFPSIAAELDPEKNGDSNSEFLFPNSKKRMWWKCKVCERTWEAPIYQRTRFNSQCPYCTRKIPIPGKNDLKSRYPSIAAEWDPEKNGDLTPEHVTVSCNKKVWWKCHYGHSWKTTVYCRTRGSRCPHCLRSNK